MKTTFIPTPTSRCRLGVARTEITPPVGMYHRMWGAAKHERSTGIHRPLFADAVIIESADASQRHVFAMLDHCMFRPPEMSELRRRTCELLKLPPERLTILFSHTHGAGLLTRERSHFPGGDLIGPYLDALPGRIAEVVNSAIKTVQPVTLTYGSVDCRMGHHRDAFDEAAGIFVCGFNPDIEWPLPVKTIRATNFDGKHVATLVNYPCHPTTLAWENTLVSPDYIGALRETVEAATKAPCIFTLAPCGEIGPREDYVGDVSVADRNGQQVGYAALQALAAMPPAACDFHYIGPVFSGATLGDWRYRPQTDEHAAQAGRFQMRRIEVLLDYLPSLPTVANVQNEMPQLSAAEQAAAARGDAAEVARLRALIERKRRLIERIQPLPPGKFPYLVEIWDIGDATWISLDGEPYYAVQSELHRRFPDRTLIFMTLANGAIASYVPTREAYDKTLYQVEVAHVAPGSLERIIDGISAALA